MRLAEVLADVVRFQTVAFEFEPDAPMISEVLSVRPLRSVATKKLTCSAFLLEPDDPEKMVETLLLKENL